MNQPSWIGQILGGRYRIEELLGQGGMSAVFKAYDPNLKRVVAIKLVHPHLADDPKFLVRFEEEATAVAKLRHPNIAQVHDYNHDGNVFYMVQEYVPGETLQERLRRLNRAGKRMKIADVIHYTLDICNAVGYAHRIGMIHRDIKPANIMLDVQDQAVLMDFGIVKMVGGQRHTATGAVVGTALYLPPELIRGEVPDPRSDIYSLGVTLFEMVNGRPPFDADSAMTLMMMHLHDNVPNLRELRPGVPDELISVIEKALKKDRNERYGSMQELASALKTAQDRIQASSTIEHTQVEETTPPAFVANFQIQPPVVDVQTEIQSSQINSSSVLNGGPQIANLDANTHLEEALTLIAGPSSSMPIPSSPLLLDEPGSTLNDDAPFVDEISDPKNISAQPTHIEQVSPVLSSQSIAAPSGKTSPERQAEGSPVIPQQLVKKQYIWIGGLVFLVLLIGGFFLANQNSAGRDGASSAAAILPSATSQPVAAVLISTDTPTPTSIPATPTITSTPTPTDIPTPTLSPTPTIPVGVPYSRIIDITVEDQNYVVEYETFEYTETLPGMHVHFFFNTIPVEQAGSPGAGPWYVWGGPRPFDRARLSERPDLATQMCILVANPNHSVQFNTGNCYILPDIVTVAPGKDMACKTGPAPEYSDAAQLDAGEIVLVRGISPDESWWNVVYPQNSADTCWLPLVDTMISGDISILPLVQPPDLPDLPDKFIEITQININAENRYVVDYVTRGFTEQLPGTHIHFFFNTTLPEQVGMSGAGSRLMHGGPSPFTGYRTIDRPPAATEICALVANPDHSIIIESGNCIKLPDVLLP